MDLELNFPQKQPSRSKKEKKKKKHNEHVGDSEGEWS
jgi:hypothetical protein